MKKHIQILNNIINLYKQIETSKWMLSLPDDWDGEGSVSYKKETWEFAIQYLIQMYKNNIYIPVPKIENGPEGSIDLFWDTYCGKVLININENKIISSYGELYGI